MTMSVDAEMAMASLQQEQADLQKRIQSLEEERRLFEKLGYSYYYLDMQLRELRAELTLCQFRIRQLGRRPSRRKAQPGDEEAPPASPGQDETRRYLVPVLGAFVVSLLALGAVGLLWVQRFAGDEVRATPTAIVGAIAPAATPTTTLTVAAPTPVPVVYAVVATEGLNVRNEASTTAAVLAILSLGDVVLLAADQVDDGGQRWYKIESGGWVAGEHVQIHPTQVEAEEAAEVLRSESQQ